MSKNSENSSAKKRSKGTTVAVKTAEWLGKCIATILLVGVITATIAGSFLFFYVMQNLTDTDNIPDLSVVKKRGTTTIYIKDQKASTAGNDVFIPQQALDGVKSFWVDLEEIPIQLQKAVIAIEDHRFYEHNGVDWKRTASATANYFLRFGGSDFGGSTITQQLIKNVDKDDDKSIARKIREIFKAINMESQSYTKDDILEAYLNILPLAGNVEGVGAAAEYYFDKDVSDLTLAECAAIAGITQNPSKYSPHNRPDNLRDRQHTILTRMLDLGVITEDEYTQAYNEELIIRDGMPSVAVQDYYVDYLIEDVARSLMEKDNEDGIMTTDLDRYVRDVYVGAYEIYSAEDPAVQKDIDKIVTNKENYPQKSGTDESYPSSGVSVLGYDGRIVAISSGPHKKEANRIENLATHSMRQPGSSIKPIAAYAPAIESNQITYSKLVKDSPVGKVDGKPWPQNYGGAGANGAMVPVEIAVQKSLNTVAVAVGKEYGVEGAFYFLRDKLHLSTVIAQEYRKVDGVTKSFSDIVDSMFLGGLTDGVTTIDMAAAFQIFGNGGFYNKPYSFYKVERDGEMIIDNTPKPESVISVESSFVMNQLLQRVIDGDSSPTGRGLNLNYTAFGKTGTTSDNKDVYFVGGTTNYVTSVWFGYRNTQVEMTSSQTRGAQSIWKKVMDYLQKGMSGGDFENKGETVVKPYCRDSGKIAVGGCTKKATGYYKPDNVPGTCDVHGKGSDDETTTKKTDTSEATTSAKEPPKTSEKPTTTTKATTTTTTTTTTAPPPPTEPDDNDD